ncbi:MAG: hypothetical protein U0L02_05080 [Kandleria vitulina]|jgi:hypothetical protein|uniref:hypothetical protein n=1 Tax=Kandleria vitulina TaxID=1630 RepID=UPI002E7864EE|nr:hypothetical protein [Kandleria vitulina]MEE0988712.1 hypothetical protein [Kandleria vitulina]
MKTLLLPVLLYLGALILYTAALIKGTMLFMLYGSICLVLGAVSMFFMLHKKK